MKKELTPSQALSRAAAWCSRGERCTADVRAKLDAGGLGGEDAGAVMDALAADGYVDDLRYAKAFANDRARLSGWGRVKIAYALRAKGIGDAAVREALDGVDDDDYAASMDKAMSAKARQMSEDDHARRRAKLIRFGVSRGYDYGAVSRWVEEHDGR